MSVQKRQERLKLFQSEYSKLDPAIVTRIFDALYPDVSAVTHRLESLQLAVAPVQTRQTRSPETLLKERPDASKFLASDNSARRAQAKAPRAAYSQSKREGEAKPLNPDARVYLPNSDPTHFAAYDPSYPYYCRDMPTVPGAPQTNVSGASPFAPSHALKIVSDLSAPAPQQQPQMSGLGLSLASRNLFGAPTSTSTQNQSAVASPQQESVSRNLTAEFEEEAIESLSSDRILSESPAEAVSALRPHGYSERVLEVFNCPISVRNSHILKLIQSAFKAVSLPFKEDDIEIKWEAELLNPKEKEKDKDKEKKSALLSPESDKKKKLKNPERAQIWFKNSALRDAAYTALRTQGQLPFFEKAGASERWPFVPLPSLIDCEDFYKRSCEYLQRNAGTKSEARCPFRHCEEARRKPVCNAWKEGAPCKQGKECQLRHPGRAILELQARMYTPVQVQVQVQAPSNAPSQPGSTNTSAASSAAPSPALRPMGMAKESPQMSGKGRQPLRQQGRERDRERNDRGLIGGSGSGEREVHQNAYSAEKNRTCELWLRNYCKYGDKCKYLHSPDKQPCTYAVEQKCHRQGGGECLRRHTLDHVVRYRHWTEPEVQSYLRWATSRFELLATKFSNREKTSREVMNAILKLVRALDSLLHDFSASLASSPSPHAPAAAVSSQTAMAAVCDGAEEVARKLGTHLLRRGPVQGSPENPESLRKIIQQLERDDSTAGDVKAKGAVSDLKTTERYAQLLRARAPNVLSDRFEGMAPGSKSGTSGVTGIGTGEHQDLVFAGDQLYWLLASLEMAVRHIARFLHRMAAEGVISWVGTPNKGSNKGPAQGQGRGSVSKGNQGQGLNQNLHAREYEPSPFQPQQHQGYPGYFSAPGSAVGSPGMGVPIGGTHTAVVPSPPTRTPVATPSFTPAASPPKHTPTMSLLSTPIFSSFSPLIPSMTPLVSKSRKHSKPTYPVHSKLPPGPPSPQSSSASSTIALSTSFFGASSAQSVPSSSSSRSVSPPTPTALSFFANPSTFAAAPGRSHNIGPGSWRWNSGNNSGTSSGNASAPSSNPSSYSSSSQLAFRGETEENRTALHWDNNDDAWHRKPEQPSFSSWDSNEEWIRKASSSTSSSLSGISKQNASSQVAPGNAASYFSSSMVNENHLQGTHVGGNTSTNNNTVRSFFYESN